MIQEFKTRLVSKTQLNTDTVLFSFALDVPSELKFLAGQYMILMVPQDGKQAARRLYSLPSSISRTDGFDLLVELVPGGVGSEYLKSLNMNDVVTFQGPAGMFTLRETRRPRIFLATGTGIAPMLSMLDATSNLNPLTSYLFWGMKYFKDVYLLDQLKNYESRNPNFKFKICLSREVDLSVIEETKKLYFDLGHIDVCMEKELQVKGSLPAQASKLQDFDFYLCGSRNMVETVRQSLYQKEIPQNQVFFEKF